jgi:hypothetical protein
VRDQAGDAAVLVDPSTVESIAEGMRRLWCEPELRADLAERGRVRLADLGFDSFRERLCEIVDAAKRLTRTGGSE